MTPDLSSRLDTLVEENLSFAAYRLPGSDVVRLVLQEKAPASRLRRIEELNGQSGFVIAPFKTSESCPLLLIHPDREERFPAPEGTGPFSGIGHPLPSTRADAGYETRFHTFMTPVKEKRFRKLVLSRQTTIKREDGFSTAEAFLLACTGYARSYVYLLHTPETGTWLGCTPEILLSGGSNQWNTVALAGTQLLRHGALSSTWDDKNLIEQMLVAYYVRTQLSSFGIRPEENGPYTVKAGCLAHLKTDFHFHLPDAGRLGDLLNLLHPTPAVSGLPKEEACRFILENEGYNRRYYSGFVGWLDVEGETKLYVNLRCMYIQPHSLTLYTGGGLLPSSELQTEWQETEDKLQTMLFAIGNRPINKPNI